MKHDCGCETGVSPGGIIYLKKPCKYHLKKRPHTMAVDIVNQREKEFEPTKKRGRGKL